MSQRRVVDVMHRPVKLFPNDGNDDEVLYLVLMQDAKEQPCLVEQAVWCKSADVAAPLLSDFDAAYPKEVKTELLRLQKQKKPLLDVVPFVFLSQIESSPAPPLPPALPPAVSFMHSSPSPLAPAQASRPPHLPSLLPPPLPFASQPVVHGPVDPKAVQTLEKRKEQQEKTSKEQGFTAATPKLPSTLGLLARSSSNTTTAALVQNAKTKK